MYCKGKQAFLVCFAANGNLFFLNILRTNDAYYTITVFWWGKCVDLLTFDEVNVWIYWLLKKIIFTELERTKLISFFSSQLIHTFTESKDSNCCILYVEEIVVFWNKKLHAHCPEVVLQHCLHNHAIIWIFII
jgi:hypothetical protein